MDPPHFTGLFKLVGTTLLILILDNLLYTEVARSLLGQIILTLGHDPPFLSSSATVTSEAPTPEGAATKKVGPMLAWIPEYNVDESPLLTPGKYII